MKKKLAIFLISILLLGVVSACSNEDTEDETTEEEKVAVEIEEVEKDTLSNSLTLGGRAIMQAEMMITADSSLKVDDIKKGLGKKVEKDDVLFTLKDGEEIKEIKSPLEGIISTINMKEDEYVPLTKPAMVIVDKDAPMTISMNVSENVMGELFIGKEAWVDIDSIDEQGLNGKIVSISPTVDQKTGLYTVNILLDEENRNIKPGMAATVKIDTNVVKNALKVRSESILNIGEKNIVYIVKDNKAIEKEVKVGLDTGDFTEIKSGLNEGDKVIFKGQNYIEDNSEVEVVRGEKDESN
ncbi:efflux RND transporter periplasmic adaptor subunit [Senegalia massiliensis]|uniref:efflux RND transporter periplasmic adaptor subunit n=1 Tax=Senegalia massiliensis TaxID=1720316 RepID=UPI001030976B|nr:efflux RND transporter periplasmic adaptor subunit [Senegalia massiliensis]